MHKEEERINRVVSFVLVTLAGVALNVFTNNLIVTIVGCLVSGFALNYFSGRPRNKATPEQPINQPPTSASNVCARCGAPLDPKNRFCRNCGARVNT